jgi:hypothetical protein
MIGRLLGAVAAVLALCGIDAGAAAAEGAGSIAAAPYVSFSKVETGNRANGLHVFDNTSYIQGWSSFWRVKVHSGDNLRIFWSAVPGTGMHINLFPAGTSDFNVRGTGPLAHQG